MSGTERKTIFTTDTDNRELVVTRLFDAPRELVFEAFSKCEHLAHWWGPKNWTLPICNMDFRPGGTWQYCMEGPGGERSYGISTYQEIVPVERIAYTDQFADENFNPNTEMPTMVSVTEYIEEDGKTRLISRTKFGSVAEIEQVMAMGMEEGLTETWDRLEEYVTNV